MKSSITSSLLDTQKDKKIERQQQTVLREGLWHEMLKRLFGDWRDDYETITRTISVEKTSYSLNKNRCRDSAIKQLEAVSQLWTDNARRHFEGELQPIIKEQYAKIGIAIKALQDEFEEACKKAQQDALDAGYSVLTVRQNVLVEISPDGSSQVRKQLSESVQVVRGQKIKRAS